MKKMLVVMAISVLMAGPGLAWDDNQAEWNRMSQQAEMDRMRDDQA